MDYYMNEYERQSQFCSVNNQTDFGPTPCVMNIVWASNANENYRTALWTGGDLQLTLMTIPSFEDIGIEIHPDNDQYLRIEGGSGLFQMGEKEEEVSYQQWLVPGDGIFVPAGTWHNIINVGDCPLRISSVYAPPHHPRGTVHQTKQDAMDAE